MKCPVCGAAELVPDTRDLPYPYTFLLGEGSRRRRTKKMK
jgi:hypothetical protein